MKKVISFLLVSVAIGIMLSFVPSQKSYAGDGGDGMPLGDEYIRFDDVSSNDSDNQEQLITIKMAAVIQLHPFTG